MAMLQRSLHDLNAPFRYQTIGDGNVDHSEIGQGTPTAPPLTHRRGLATGQKSKPLGKEDGHPR